MTTQEQSGISALQRALLSRRTVLRGALGISATALLAACGGDDEELEPTTSAAQPTSLPATATSAPTTTAEPTTRTFLDVYGQPIQVPDNPQRIVAIHDNNGGAQLLSLGAPVVGLPVRGGTFTSEISDVFDVEGIGGVGEVYEPDIEAIIALKPDLIVGEGYAGQGMDQFMGDGAHDLLAEIAPVVYIDTFRSVEEVMTDFAYLLGGEYFDVAAQQKAELDTLIADLTTVIGEEWATVTASYVARHDTAGTLQTSGPTGTAFTDVLTRVGVAWVPLVLEAGWPQNGGYLGDISNERINEFDADLLVVDAFWEQTLLDDPLFESLEVVQEEQIIVAGPDDGSFWGAHYPNYLRTTQFLLDEVTALQPLNTDIINEGAAP